MPQEKSPQFTFAKPPFDTLRERVYSPLGQILVEGPAPPERILNLDMAEGLNCFRQVCRQKKCLAQLAGQEDGMVFTAVVANRIVSYVTFQKPDYPWWQERCFSRLLELGSIETDPAWRKMGLTTTMLDQVLKNPAFPYFEDFIIIAVQFIHSWDLATTGLNPWAYRALMTRFFGRYGFVPWETVDPEVREHPCNLLLARSGRETSPADSKHFASCCLGTLD